MKTTGISLWGAMVKYGIYFLDSSFPPPMSGVPAASSAIKSMIRKEQATGSGASYFSRNLLNRR
jgi:hypothetical protein